jgi:glycosyltransferase involved in cell wall biosynthesis
LLLVNQHTVPVFTDVVNAFAEKHSDTVLFTGHIEDGGKPLSEKVCLVKSFLYRRNNSFTRLFSWLAFTIHYSFYLLRWQKPKTILVVTNPPTAPIITAFIAGIRRIPFYILVFDLYPDALSQAGFVESKSYLFRMWKKINAWVFKKATKIFTLSESMKENVAAYLPDDSRSIKVIHNWADGSYIRPIRKAENPFLQTHKLSAKKIILYSGNIGLTHDLESLAGAAELLRDEKDLCFVFIGGGGKRKLLEEMVSSKGLDNVIFLPYQDSVNFPLAITAADIGVVTLGKGAEGISVPSKTYISLAAGLCLLAIAPKNSELGRLIDVHQAGLVCEPGDAQGVANTIKRLLSDELLLEQYKMNALKASLNFTSENARQYVQEIMSVN